MMKRIKKLSIRNGNSENWTEFYITKKLKNNKTNPNSKINPQLKAKLKLKKMFFKETCLNISSTNSSHIKTKLKQTETRDYFSQKNSKFRKINKNRINSN